MEEIIPVFRVSELNRAIRENLEANFSNIWVEGEISGLKESSLGHIYFDLKDNQSLINCVLFKWSAEKFRFNLENGLFIRVKADVTIYDRQSRYQLLIKEVIPLKWGELQLAFEQLKEKLRKEGLFDEKRKKKIPKFPSKIAIVTSLYGAAIKDILSILKRRFSNLHILIYPVKVQGEGAKEEISQAIYDLNAYFKDVDVILVGRGGGSIEDLWAFNEEIVARAIADSSIPIISCVGHETDFTIADFVADLRAPTPSAAAELVVANKEDLIKHLFQLEKRLIHTLRIIYSRVTGKFLRFINSKFFKNPFALIEKKAQNFDELFENLNFSMSRKIETYQHKLEILNEKLKSLNPYFPLKKGYVLVKKDEKLIRRACQLKIGDNVNINFLDGLVESEVKRIEALKGEV